jgi:signal transduction histidine kinase
LIGGGDNRALNSLRAHLQARGYTVVAASSGDKVISLVYEHHPYLLILDSDLPDKDSYVVCQTLKADKSLGFVPVLLMVDESKYVHDDDMDFGPDATIFKPIDGDELLAWLRFLLRMKRQLDNLIRENQALSAASQAIEVLKSDIINNVSHELSTPLVQVKAAVALLAEDSTQNGTREQSSMANMAQQAVARLEGAVDNIRQLAQTHNIKLGAVIVNEAVDLAIRHLERSWASRSARVRVEKRIDANLPLVLGDKRAMARLLQLLLDNALKFSADDTPVYVLAWQIDEKRVGIAVQDQGIGIEAAEHQRIFQAFYQVDGSSTRRYGGTGNGLALALLLANGMHTEIHLQSEPGKGSIFSFELPVANLDDL